MSSISTAAFRRGRRIAAASVVAIAAFSLTACNAPGGDDPKPAKSAASEAPGNGSSDGSTGSSGGAAGSAGGDTGSTGAGSSGSQGSGGSTGGSGSGHRGSGTSGGSGSTGSGGSTGSTGSGGGTGTGHKGANVTLNGTLKYLAPGKYTVAPESGMEQAFFVATDTRILGATTICGGPDGRVTIDKSSYGTTTCTTDDLEKAAKMNTVKVRVTVKKGIATQVVERYHP
ncbi:MULTISPECIES: hypothetical protein [Streptomyces]|uniref:Uncharacterized protein n=2 Tax=Streptomyces rimosus subsp. rimosus TaxID=132474 RepID=L8EU05_STRR1|nr:MULTISPECIES: hypothetical protein [Streptomyces]KOG69189.1 hypothetical protein ADK78_34370 [Kitasatospora aureofaciens]MYT43413.1 hypothetical protein [Streptomyces sp. SID5471]KEF04746.1 hypothetical protein DF17_22950 [Streptomyces rimosus]KEF19854.1 hypothetical protein DF18_13425 [Streptomyces rimosus]KOT31304.1 hypothetical protein ADK42_28785 [Streptomyces rimosus subsp. rimosus]